MAHVHQEAEGGLTARGWAFERGIKRIAIVVPAHAAGEKAGQHVLVRPATAEAVASWLCSIQS
jgi:hypothetical protein